MKSEVEESLKNLWKFFNNIMFLNFQNIFAPAAKIS